MCISSKMVCFCINTVFIITTYFIDDYYDELEEEIVVEEELEDALADLMVERQSLLKREEALDKNIEAGLSIIEKKHLKQRLLN